MAILHKGGISLHYEETGSGYPVLLFAPGAMRSSIEFWEKSPFNPIRELADQFRVISMDQRNAGSSRAPIQGTDGWQTYTSDHLALLDHLNIEQCHIMGGCIGSAYCLSLIATAPERVRAAVLQNPVGVTHENRPLFFKGFDDWAAGLDPALTDDTAALLQFKNNMFGTDFVFSTTREQVRKMNHPLLILAGNDPFHPTETAREIAALAKNAELVLEWKTPEIVPETVKRVKTFLRQNTPGT